MAEQQNSRPVLYLLHGEDQATRERVVAQFRARLGDPTLAAMNTLRLEGAQARLEAWRDAAFTAPFLTTRRLIHLVNPAWDAATRRAVLDLLPDLPPTTALLIEWPHTLEDTDPLLQWAQAHPERAWVRHCPQAQGDQMAAWIQKAARAEGGAFTPAAAKALAEQVGDDTLLALQEIRKLLAYVNYQRPVEPEEVFELATAQSHPNIFHMVDAMGTGQARQALRLLHQLLSVEETPKIWGMLIRQFRLMLLAREALEEGITNRYEIAKRLGVPPFVAEKVLQQARRFSLANLEALYRRLLEVDYQAKSGGMELTNALYQLVAAVTMK